MTLFDNLTSQLTPERKERFIELFKKLQVNEMNRPYFHLINTSLLQSNSVTANQFLAQARLLLDQQQYQQLENLKNKPVQPMMPRPISIQPQTSQQQQQQQQSATLAPRKRKLMPNNDIHRNKRIELCGNGNTKYVMRPLLPNQPLAPATSATTAETSRLDPVEPDAFHKHHHQQHQHLPSPPMKPMPRLLNPESRSLPSLHSLPSPPLTAKEMFKDQGASSSAVTTAAAMATVSALLNPTQKTHQMLEAHRHELQREVTNLTSLLSRTTAMLQNLDQVMAVTKEKQPATTNSTQQQPHVTNALMSLFALAAAKETSGSSA